MNGFNAYAQYSAPQNAGTPSPETLNPASAINSPATGYYPPSPMAAPVYRILYSDDASIPRLSFSAALLASVLAGTTSLGRNLYLAKKGEMPVGDAVVKALGVGAAATFSTTVAAGLASAINTTETTKLLIFAGATTGISYALMNAADYTVAKQRMRTG